MKELIVAIKFLTRLPMPRVETSREDFARSIRWFPAVGFILGALIALAAWLGSAVDPWTGALFALLIWVALTGALHLDGLGDIADAAGAAHKGRETISAVLADPHIGSFGVVTIVLQLLAKLVLAHALIDRGLFLTLLLVPFAARIGPLIWTKLMPPLHDGLGTMFRGAVRPIDIGVWLLALIGAAWLVPGILFVPLLMLLWALWLQRKIGGISGDGHGAGIEIVESGMMLSCLTMAVLV